MVTRYWPLGLGRIITSPFGPREGGFHTGCDFGFPGGSGGRPVYAIQSGTVLHAGSAQGYGGDPSGRAGWVVIDSDDSQGAGCIEYGHIVRLGTINVGDKVVAGQQIAVINPDSNTNGGVSPHLHVSDMPREYNPSAKQDPLPRLKGALDPGVTVVPAAPVAAPVGKPDFNEYPIISPNGESRFGTKIDLWLLHTEEGGPVKGGADRLARWLGDPARQVSYHYCISEDPDDHGVTVVDVRDPATSSWSCLSANSRSVNAVFAGSKASWTRQDWLRWAPKAIDVAAYLAARDCKRFGIAMRVIKPPYGPPGGVSDHRYVTSFLRDGTHTDVGGPMGAPWTGFPWDVFEAAFTKYCAQYFKRTPSPSKTASHPAEPAPIPVYPDSYTDRQLLESIWRRLDGLTAAYNKGQPK